MYATLCHVSLRRVLRTVVRCTSTFAPNPVPVWYSSSETWTRQTWPAPTSVLDTWRSLVDVEMEGRLKYTVRESTIGSGTRYGTCTSLCWASLYGPVPNRLEYSKIWLRWNTPHKILAWHLSTPQPSPSLHMGALSPESMSRVYFQRALQMEAPLTTAIFSKTDPMWRWQRFIIKYSKY